jgi:hypothetical protein
MKRILLLFALIFALGVSASAQVYYRSIGQNVRVRTAPSLKASIAQNQIMEPVHLFKGEIVEGLGVQRNGFTKVAHVYTGQGRVEDWEGWVATKYLVRAYKCKSCGGEGFYGTCDACGGIGTGGCCGLTGKNRCKRCYGYGYK